MPENNTPEPEIMEIISRKETESLPDTSIEGLRAMLGSL